MVNLSKLRNSVIDATVKVLTQAKAKPPTPGKELDRLINHGNLSIKDKRAALAHLQTAIKELQCSNSSDS